MIIKDIILVNWMCFEGMQVLNDLPAGAIGVVARYADNPKRSNWGGKTAFLEAIEWCLFGVHRKRLEDDVIFNGNPNVLVTLCLDNGIEIQRTRERGKSTKLQVIPNIVATTILKQKDAEEYISKLLGFDQHDYRATLCFAQGDTSSIVERRSSERRKMIDKWLDMLFWVRVHSRAKAHLSTTQQVLIDNSLVLSDYESELLAKDVTFLAKNVGEASDDVRLATEEEQRLIVIQKKIDRSKLVQSTQDRIAEINDECASLTLATVGRLEDVKEEIVRKEHIILEASKIQLSAKIKELERLVASGFDGVCPLVKETCPSCSFVDEHASKIQEELDQITAEHKMICEQHKLSSKALADAMEHADNIISMKGRYKLLTEEYVRLSFDVEDVEKFSDVYVSQIEEELTTAGNVRLFSNIALITAETEEKLHAEIVKRVERFNEDRAVTEEHIKIARLASQILGPGGLPARIAESMLGTLQEGANTLLHDTGLSFEFSWQRKTKQLVGACPECGYAYRGQKDKRCPACKSSRPMKDADDVEILVDDGSGSVEDVKVKSGGAKVLVGSAIRLAAGLMLKDRRDSQCEWAQIDEPFGTLDVQNRTDLAKTFASMLNSVGISQAFIVSHDMAVLDAIPGQIEIVRKDNRSKIRLVS